MATAVLLCTPEDVYTRAGGQARLTQLIDPQGTGTYDPNTLNTAIADASDEVLAALGVASDLSGFQLSDFQQKFRNAIRLTAWIAIYNCWKMGSSGQACPDWIDKDYTRATVELTLLAERRRKHGDPGFSTSPAQRVSIVDNDPHHDRMTLRSFKRGFI